MSPAPPAAAGGGASGAGVLVTVRAPDPAIEIERVFVGPRFTRLEVCPGACGLRLDPRGEYRVSGPGVSPSALFRLPPDRGAVTVTVAPGSYTWMKAAAVVLGSGIVLSAAGGGTYAAARWGGGGDRLRAGGLVTGLAGLGLAGVGGALALAHRTRVELE